MTEEITETKRRRTQPYVPVVEPEPEIAPVVEPQPLVNEVPRAVAGGTLKVTPNPVQAYTEYTLNGTGADNMSPVLITIYDPEPTSFLSIWPLNDGTYEIKRGAGKSGKYRIEAYQRSPSGSLYDLANETFMVLDSEMLLGGVSQKPLLTVRREKSDLVIDLEVNPKWGNSFIEVVVPDVNYSIIQQVTSGEITLTDVPLGAMTIRLLYTKIEGQNRVWPVLTEVMVDA